jgi:hypothetical protein
MVEQGAWAHGSWLWVLQSHACWQEVWHKIVCTRAAGSTRRPCAPAWQQLWDMHLCAVISSNGRGL